MNYNAREFGAESPGATMTDKRPLVLVVDDYQDAREMYAEYLSYS